VEQKLLLPRLKSWIRNVVAEGDETEGKQHKSKIDEETAEAVKASASAVSAIAKTNQELLASKDEGSIMLVQDFSPMSLVILDLLGLIFYLVTLYLFYVIAFLLTERKILMTLTQALDFQAKVLKSLSESLSHDREAINITREDKFSHYGPLEEHASPAVRNGQYQKLSSTYM
jgi:peroxin-14